MYCPDVLPGVKDNVDESIGKKPRVSSSYLVCALPGPQNPTFAIELDPKLRRGPNQLVDEFDPRFRMQSAAVGYKSDDVVLLGAKINLQQPNIGVVAKVYVLEQLLLGQHSTSTETSNASYCGGHYIWP